MTDSTIASSEVMAPHRRLALGLPAWLVLICIVALTALLAAGCRYLEKCATHTRRDEIAAIRKSF